MQTFLPFASFEKSAQCLDYRRLGKQRVEAKQIYNALIDPAYGWQNHPAVDMWRGYEGRLAEYGQVICSVWKSRGYKDTLWQWFKDRASYNTGSPYWLGNNSFHVSHQSNLLRKDKSFYEKWFPNVPADLPYIWPTKDL